MPKKKHAFNDPEKSNMYDIQLNNEKNLSKKIKPEQEQRPEEKLSEKLQCDIYDLEKSEFSLGKIKLHTRPFKLNFPARESRSLFSYALENE